MKHYLLTWYGMTDLRAALGVEDTDGPVLSALKTGDYSDVVILAYTNPEKDQRAFAGALRERWEAWAGAPNSDRAPLARTDVQQIVDVVSNTEAGHDLFSDWLQNQLAAAGCPGNPSTHPTGTQAAQRRLRHLQRCGVRCASRPARPC